MRSLLPLLACLLGGCAIVVDDGAGAANNLTATTPDAGTDAPGGGGTPASGGSAGSGGVCFGATDPPFVTPREPTMTAAEACVAGGERKNTFASEDELLSLIVGTWIRCGTSASWFLSQPGFVIGGDRTFRFLEDASGTLRETAVLGRAKVIALGGGLYQVDIERDGGLTNMLHFTQIGAGDRVEIVETGGAGSFARTAPGVAAKPSTYVDSGKCSLVGAWDSQAGVGDGFAKSSGTFAFDGKGHFAGGALGSNICASPTINGTYRLVDDRFEIVTSTGMGCPATYAAGWDVKFSSDCRTAHLAMKYDNCTGARHSLEYDSVLTRR